MQILRPRKPLAQPRSLGRAALPAAGAVPALTALPAAGAWLQGLLMLLFIASPAGAIGYMDGIGRDTFPVFDNPKLLTVAEAEARKAVLPREPVIGVVHGGEARAYPIAIMGMHELGNDTIAGVPIAVTW